MAKKHDLLSVLKFGVVGELFGLVFQKGPRVGGWWALLTSTIDITSFVVLTILCTQ